MAGKDMNVAEFASAATLTSHPHAAVVEGVDELMRERRLHLLKRGLLLRADEDLGLVRPVVALNLLPLLFVGANAALGAAATALDRCA